MIIIYVPKDGEPEHFDARTLRVSEASIVQRLLSRKWGEVEAGIREEDLEDLRAVAWVIKKRVAPSLRYDDFDPGIDELGMRLDPDEVVAYVRQAIAFTTANNPDATPAQIREALTELPNLAFDPEHARRTVEELAANPKDQAAPETTSLPSGTPTSSPDASAT
ncbi:hypothetical protein ACGFMM_01330 [Streptomyces sp. NPDC048604]|uniref:hypothetical protein n=1 Tax=Streptomyces sp. NPDC048604 TaxID=3365578 RepID=UPI0037115831